jgi:two-component system, OmpR family, sensor histidine kinase TctE
VTETLRNPSLRRRLLLNLLLPGLILASLLGVAGATLIHNVVTTTHDRLLDGALMSVTERIGVEEGEVTVDIPLAAFGMLESGAQDSIFYSVMYDGKVVTGYSDLPLDPSLRQERDRIVYWDGSYKGQAVRLAGEMHWVYGKPKPVLVAIAETVSARRGLERRMLLALVLLETLLLTVMAVLAWLAVDRGLRPLTTLSADIDARGVRDALSFDPLNLTRVPREALAPVIALNALLRRLGDSVGAIQRFTADASHQMLTPLAIMQTHLALARRHLDTPVMVGTALSELDNAVRRLDHMASQLIALARADEPGAVQTQPVSDLGQIVAELVAERFPQALAAGIEMQVERPDGAIPVRGNGLLIRELTANLLDNAVRYNHPCGSVDVRIAVAGAATRMAIEDTGPGIPVAERARVFERFYRIPHRDGPQGSGLGLAIVRASCDQIGASITLGERAAGSGLVVTIMFITANGDAALNAESVTG